MADQKGLGLLGMIFSGVVVMVAAIGFVVVLQHVDGNSGIAAEAVMQPLSR